MTALEFLQIIREHVPVADYATNNIDVHILEFELEDATIQIVIEEYSTETCH
jgi:hypothetical protein